MSPRVASEGDDRRVGQKTRWGLVLILVVAWWLRVWGSEFGLPLAVHPDEGHYLPKAVAMTWSDLSPHYFANPNLLTHVFFVEARLLHAVGRAVGGFQEPIQESFAQDPTLFYLLARWTSALCGVLTVWLTYLVGRRAMGPVPGVLAAGLLGASFLHARDSHYAVNDVPVTCLLMVSVWLCCRYAQRGRFRDVGLAAFVGGLAMATKYSALVVVAPLTAAVLSRPGAIAPEARRNTLHLLARLYSFVLYGFLVGCPFIFFDNYVFLKEVYRQLHYDLQPWPGQPDLPTLVAYVWGLALGLGWPALLLAVVGVVMGRRVMPKAVQIVLLAMPVAYLFVMGRSHLFFTRFCIPLLPFVALYAALGIERASRLGAIAGSVRGALLAALTALVIVPNVVVNIRHNALLTRRDTRLIAREWLIGQLPTGTRIARESYTPSLDGLPYEVTEIMYKTKWPDVTQLRQRGIEYVVLSSFRYGRYITPPYLVPEMAASYASIQEGATLVKEVNPFRDGTAPPFMVDDVFSPLRDLWLRERPGPIIKVYRL